MKPQSSPFPDVKVIVLNENEPDTWTEPRYDFKRKEFVNKEIKWNGDIEMEWDGVPYLFKSGEGLEIDPEVAWALFCFDTRPEVEGGPPVYKRRFKGGTNESRNPDYYKVRLSNLGWADDERKEKWFENFRFKVAKGKKVYTKAEMAAIK